MVKITVSKVQSLASDYSFLLFLHSNKFEVKFDKVVLIIICAHLEICTKRISSLRLGVDKPIFTEPKATFCVHCRRCVLVENCWFSCTLAVKW